MSSEVTVIEIQAKLTDSTEPNATNAIKNVSKLEKAMQKSEAQVNRMKSMGKIGITASLTDKASKGIQNIAKLGKSIGGKVWTVTLKAIDLVTSPVRGLFKLLSNPIVGLGSLAGITLGVSDTVKTFKDFEQSLANVKAVANATDADMNKLTKTAKDLGAATVFSAQEVGQGMYYLGQAGWKTNSIITAMPGLLDLAAAGDVELATATDILASTMASFGLQASEAGRVADVFAQTASSSQTGIAELGETFKYVGAVAGSMGYEIEDVAIALGLMANKSIDGSMAGTALRAMFSRMAKKPKEAAAAMDKLGLSLTDDKDQMKSFMTVMEDMRKGFGNMKQDQKLEYAAMLGGQESMSAILAFANASEQDFTEMTKAIKGSTGAAQKMAKTRMNTFAGSLEILRSTVESLQIEVMERFAPHLRDAVDWLISKMPDISHGVSQMADNINSKIKTMRGSIDDLMSSDEWKTAETPFDKLKLAWDKVIAEPFTQWWENSGKAWLTSASSKIGSSIGGAINGGLLCLLGVNDTDVMSDGMSIGKSFAEGFMREFDGAKIWSAFLEKVKSTMSAMTTDAKTVLPGQKTSQTGWMSAALLAAGSLMLGKKAYGLGKGAIGAGKGLIQGTKWLTGIGKASASSASSASSAAIGQVITPSANAVSSVGSASAKLTNGLKALAVPSAKALKIPLLDIGVSALRMAFASKNYAESHDDKNAAKAMLGPAGSATGSLAGAFLGPIGSIAGSLLGEACINALTDAFYSDKKGLLDLVNPNAVHQNDVQKQLLIAENDKARLEDPKGYDEKRLEAFSYEVPDAMSSNTQQSRALELPMYGPYTLKQEQARLQPTYDIAKSKEYIFGKFKGETLDFTDDMATVFDGTKDRILKSFEPLPTDVNVNAWEPMKRDADNTVTSINQSLSKVGSGVTFNIPKIDIPSGLGQSQDLSSLSPLIPSSPSVVQSNALSFPVLHAEGGFMTRAHTGTVAEDGAEVIIPLSSKKRSRGLSLWKQTGTLLGVTQDRSTLGQSTLGQSTLGQSTLGQSTLGQSTLDQPPELLTQPSSMQNHVSGAWQNRASDFKPLKEIIDERSSAPSTPINIDNITIELNIGDSGDTSPDAIIRAVHENMKNITDDLASQIAQSLHQVFANMPKAIGTVY